MEGNDWLPETWCSPPTFQPLQLGGGVAGKKKKIPVGRHRFVNKQREAARLTLRLSRFYFKLALLAFIAADVRVLQGPIATQPPAAPFSDFSANSFSLFFLPLFWPIA